MAVNVVHWGKTGWYMACAVFYASLMLVSCRHAPELRAPNILIFIADDVSFNDLGAYGNRAVSTPNIDRLASQGMLFTRAFLTTSSCSPSRASILSGRYPHNTGAPELHMPLPGSVATLAGQLKAHQYFTGASGKWHLGPEAKKDFHAVYDTEIGPGGEDRWLELVNQIPDGKPFFLWMASLDAHRGWGENPFDGSAKLENALLPPYLVPDSATVADFGHYYDEIARFDHYVGEVLKVLKAREMLENTLVFILADNGRPFPRDKTRMYDSGIQTPLIAYWESGPIPKGSRSDAMVSVIDLAPTISRLCGLLPLDSFQGMDFSEVLGNPEKEHRQFVFAEHNWHDYRAYERMVRTADFLYIENRTPEGRMSSAADVHAGPAFQQLALGFQNGTLNPLQLKKFAQPNPRSELYAVRQDPHQLNNLVGDSAHLDLVRSLARKLREWQALTADSAPANLTGDHYDFFTGQSLFPDRAYDQIDRGEIPGASGNAVSLVSKDKELQ